MKLTAKIDEHAFEAEGSPDFVQSTFAVFLWLVEMTTTNFANPGLLRLLRRRKADSREAGE